MRFFKWKTLLNIIIVDTLASYANYVSGALGGVKEHYAEFL